MPTTAEQEIYSRLTSAPTFHPANAVLFQRDWTLEPGDVVTVNSGEDSYSVPIYALKLNWMGSDQSTSANADRIKASIESTGNEKREPLPELRRKEYQTARSSYGYYRAQQQEIDEHYRHLTQTTDRGMAEAFGIIGVKLGPDGMPLKDANGNYIWDDSGTGGEIWGHLNHDAWSTQIMHHIKDENGNILSLGEVYTDAYGNVLINAINGEGSGELKINANRIAIQSTSGSGITFDTDGNISINAGEVVNGINNQSGTVQYINAGIIKLNGAVIVGEDSQGNTGLTSVGGVFTHIDVNWIEAANINVEEIDASASVASPYLQGDELYVTQDAQIDGTLTIGENEADVSGAIFDLRIVAPAQGSNTYTLQKKSFSDSDWENVGTFSRATTLSGAWSSGVYTVTASPQGNTESTQIYLGATGNGSSNFSVNTYHDSIAAANIAISDYIYLTEEVAAKTVSAHWHNAQGTVYGVISTQATYNAGWGAAYGKVDLPDPLTGLESNDTLTMDVIVPAQTVGTDATTTYALSATQWNGNTAFAKLKAGNDDILRLTLDATPRYRAGSYAVTLNNPDWGTAPSPLTENRTVSVSTSGRVDSNGTDANLTKDIALYLTQGSFDSAHKLTVSLRDTSSSGTVRAETEVDASSLVSAVQQSGSIAINTNNPPTYYGSTTPPSISCSVIGTLTNGNSIGGTVLISGGAVQDAYDDGYADCHLSYEWGTGANANRLIIGKTTSGSANSLSFDVTAGASIDYDSSTHKYTATGKAYVDSAQKDSDTADSGTEAYYDGYGDGYDHAESQLTTLSVTSNGTYTPSFGYSSVTVNVPTGTHNILITASERFNNEPTTSTQIFEDTGAYADLHNARAGYYTFKVSCGGTDKWYYFRVGSP